MITIRTVENIKLGSKITFFNGIYAVLLGILYIAFYPWILNENFKAINKIWQLFYKYNPEISFLYVMSIILKGVLIISLGIAIIYLSNFIIKRKDRPAWIILFIIGIIFWPALLIIEALTKNIYTIIAAFIGWLTFIMGMLIPIRYYLQRSYSEY